MSWDEKDPDFWLGLLVFFVLVGMPALGVFLAFWFNNGYWLWLCATLLLVMA